MEQAISITVINIWPSSSTCVDRTQVCERGYETGFVVMGTHLSLTS